MAHSARSVRRSSLTGQGGERPEPQRFLFLAPTGQTAQTPFAVVLNWQAALKPQQ
jgi:hypothetical protein